MDLKVIPSTCSNDQPTWISPYYLIGDLNILYHVHSVLEGVVLNQPKFSTNKDLYKVIQLCLREPVKNVLADFAG